MSYYLKRFITASIKNPKQGFRTTNQHLCTEKEVEIEAPRDLERESEWPRRVVTGLQPTGSLHVGNYFGVLRRAARLQAEGDDVTVFIADLHALTAGGGPGLRERVLDSAAAILAAGICPDRGVVFAQSAVPRHAELCWYLATITSHARLASMPQYKEKIAEKTYAGEAGLLLYPVLQAADILLHRATHVPVGADQSQHVQLARLLANTFRHRYGRAFPAPQPLIADDGSDRIRSLRAPEKKMSKSDKDAKSRIMLSDSDSDIDKKVRKAVTDFTPQITYDPENRPGVSNLVRLHCLAADLTPEEAVEEAAHLNTVGYKKMVAQVLIKTLAPVRQKMQELRKRPKLLEDILRHGAVKARHRADETYESVTKLLGLR